MIDNVDQLRWPTRVTGHQNPGFHSLRPHFFNCTTGTGEDTRSHQRRKHPSSPFRPVSGMEMTVTAMGPDPPSILCWPTTELEIYEGERKLVQHNNFLGKFTIEGLSKGVAESVKIKLVFDLDKNGILHARASHRKNDGTTVHAELDLNYNEKRTANKRSIKEMVSGAKRFKEQDQVEFDRKTALSELEVAIRKVQYEIANAAPHDKSFKEDQCRAYEDWIAKNEDASKEVFERKLKAFEIACGIESDDEDNE
ncbi:hsp70 protein [Ditylenchus destructor]|nr:hsp70 protein [Ditylenchus destructor]